MKFILKIAIIFGAIAWLLSSSVPRLMSDLWHARDYVPAQGYTATKYECTNVNGFMPIPVRRDTVTRGGSSTSPG